MIINLSEIMSVKDKTEHIEAPIDLAGFQLDGMEYPFEEKGLVLLDITSSGERQISFEAKARVSLHIPCGRCLDDTLIPFDIQVSKDLDFSESDADRIKELEELNYIDGYNLDVDLLIYDEILLKFPLRVLCREECRGICMKCGKNLNKESCDCNKSIGDPRMSVIQDIFKNYKEV